VIAVSLGFGRWSLGSRDIHVDDILIAGKEHCGRGLHINAAVRTDERIHRV